MSKESFMRLYISDCKKVRTNRMHDLQYNLLQVTWRQETSISGILLPIVYRSNAQLDRWHEDYGVWASYNAVPMKNSFNWIEMEKGSTIKANI